MTLTKKTVRTMLAGAMLLMSAAAVSAQDFKVTLLGTATPAPRPDRFGPSTLIEAGDQKVLIDAGRGATIRLWQMRIPIGSLDAVLLTHFHSDHTGGMPDLWLTGWIGTPYGGRSEPFNVIGPAGTQQLMDGLKTAYDDDVQIRLVDEGNPVEGIEIAVEEFTEEGVVYDRGGLKVRAIEVDHGDHISPNYGYVAEYGGRKVVISGDTKFDPNTIENGRGADLIINTVATAHPEVRKQEHAGRVLAHHISPQEAGTVFNEIQPKLAVYTHIVRLSDKEHPEPTIADIVNDTRETYTGPLTVGEDLMTFDIRADGIATYMAAAR
ncbi:MBL fold metallo-hydrolase [Paracoccus caeni]|uniref:MBL fold metallo-hydrolase n=1 Tax=Paracoccus caeni TaxID=657651 RepID=A0A934W0T7_9RHOB|nr:MBL fold metallo-hydrolase [Paracoccus caeni]MBK4217290.1 MBL fold metallo-hydrolase [Paracoccus caeni]